MTHTHNFDTHLPGGKVGEVIDEMHLLYVLRDDDRDRNRSLRHDEYPGQGKVSRACVLLVRYVLRVQLVSWSGYVCMCVCERVCVTVVRTCEIFA